MFDFFRFLLLGTSIAANLALRSRLRLERRRMFSAAAKLNTISERLELNNVGQEMETMKKKGKSGNGALLPKRYEIYKPHL